MGKFIEPLEDRRLLSAVTGASLFGPIVTGETWGYETLQSGKVIATSTNKLVGATKFNGIAATELDATVTAKAAGSSAITTKSYDGLDSKKDEIAYGAVTVANISYSGYKGTSTSTTVFTPPSEIFPASLTAGTTYTATWTGKTTTAISVSTPFGPIKNTTTSTDTVKFSVELVSTTLATIVVPAGTYKCYLIDETIATTISGKTTTTTSQLWAAPSVGVVKSVTGTGSNAVTTELTSYKA